METSRTGREAVTGWCGPMGRELGRAGVRLAQSRSSSSSVTVEGREEEEGVLTCGAGASERERERGRADSGPAAEKGSYRKGKGKKREISRKGKFYFLL